MKTSTGWENPSFLLRDLPVRDSTSPHFRSTSELSLASFSEPSLVPISLPNWKKVLHIIQVLGSEFVTSRVLGVDNFRSVLWTPWISGGPGTKRSCVLPRAGEVSRTPLMRWS